MKKLVFASLCVMLFASLAMAEPEYKMIAGFYSTGISTPLATASSVTYRVAYIAFDSTNTGNYQIINIRSTTGIIGYKVLVTSGSTVFDFTSIGGISVKQLGLKCTDNTDGQYTIIYQKLYW